MRRRALLALALVAATAGCGVGAGDDVGGVTLVVTRDFGTRDVAGSPAQVDAPGGETVMRALQRAFEVRTRYGGGFVQAIEGVAGGRSGGRPFDWFFYVNGVLAPQGAASTELNRGDVVWWDHHDWGVTDRIPAVVGSFPEPFEHGVDGERLPTRVDCAESAAEACRIVRERLAEAGIIAGEAALETRSGGELLRVLVGPWPDVRVDFTARLLGEGPQASGVFAVPAGDGTSIDVLDARGEVADTLGAGTGLIAATADADERPTWVVTGTDAQGLAMAARALTVDALRDMFAIAIRDDLPIPLPVAAR